MEKVKKRKRVHRAAGFSQQDGEQNSVYEHYGNEKPFRYYVLFFLQDIEKKIAGNFKKNDSRDKLNRYRHVKKNTYQIDKENLAENSAPAQMEKPPEGYGCSLRVVGLVFF
jgi:hypothetical protein